MNTAQRIIEKFGGQTALAQLIGKGQSTVQYWAKAGTVPVKWHKKHLELAQKTGVSLAASDFIESDTPIVSQSADVPKATHWGELKIGENALPCYVLESGERVFSLKGVVVGLIETEGGQLVEYLKIKVLQDFLPQDLKPTEDGKLPCLIKFDTSGEAFTKYAWGLPVEKFMDLCGAYSSAAEAEIRGDVKLTDRQRAIAINANRFLRACAKVGIVALVDEATGYQYERVEDALQFKLKLYLEELF